MVYAKSRAMEQIPSGDQVSASQELGLLKFLTCGSVDDGKSTLIGRMLYDCQLVLEDQMAALESDSKKVGTNGGDLDLALLVDGLQAEREQGITIDVAYRCFSSPRRSFIVADTPGHVQYTRNMVTGASGCDLAVILVDARHGVLSQTKRHSCIAHLLGIRHIVLAVNKMDQVDYRQEQFQRVRDDYRDFAKALGLEFVTCIPVSALKGDNVVQRSSNMDWYDGLSLIKHLEGVRVGNRAQKGAFRLPVQCVNRPSSEFRGYSGTIASGQVAVGEEIVVLPSAKTSMVADIIAQDGRLEVAGAGEAVTLVLEDEIDVSRGDIIAVPQDRPEVADQAAAHLVWMSEDHMLPGRPYMIRVGTRWATATVTALRHKLDVDSLQELAGTDLLLNDVGLVNLSFDRQLAFDAYEDNRDTGGFILVDKLSNATVGAGMFKFALRRATNIHWQALDVHKKTRAEQKGQRPCCLWFTGFSGSGKSTVANLLEKKLHANGRHTYTLDGDNVRHGLNRDLGFTDADRVENIRRVSEVAKLMVDAGLIVLVSFISPFRAERRMARSMFGDGEFLEVFVDTPLEICEQRDPKGLYKKARAGELKNFTGIDSDYERPWTAELSLLGAERTPGELVDNVLDTLMEWGIV